ncbi:MAG: CRISPR-associated helicase Cas3' [Candidatus Bathyarchaeota archaeon]|nr:CRISPR-associated helicase Cas3' [Candidatus Bathyarchaeota archaeon]
MKPSLSCNLLARPDKKLRDHLQRVSELCNNLCMEPKLNLESINLTQDKLAKTLELLGWCHDFGKATTFFQEYIHETDEQKKRKLKNRKETHHGLISAVFTYYVLKSQYYTSDSPLDEAMPLIGYLAVKRHHGNLKDIRKEIMDLIQDSCTQDILKKQLDSIAVETVAGLYKNVFSEQTFITFKEDFDLILEQMTRSRKNLWKFLLKGSLFPAIITSFCYSILLQADKEHASGITVKRPAPLPDNIVDTYRHLKGFNEPTTKINEIRNSIYAETTNCVDSLDLAQYIYSLNAPTGTGKTLTGLAFANKLASRLRSEQGFNPRIFYCISFISIIDQNCQVFEEVFETVTGKKPANNILLKHHHLADMCYSTDEDEFKPEEGLFLVEGWNSEVIVTTFVQLFHTLFTNRNRSLRKYHRLANSIVILDEVQSLPHEYWLLFREYLKTFSVLFKTYFIFMTATQPLIFQPGTEIKELCADNDQYFRQFDRLDLVPCLEPVTLDGFMEQVSTDIEGNPDKSFLIIMNTIRSSQQLYQHLQKSMGKKNLFYLSTMIFPKERLDRITQIRKGRKRKIIVSTQLVEAGVDLDVDVVYRDFGTLDSVVQASGRCNRNFNEKRGLVKLFRIQDDRRFFYSYIYGGNSMLIDKTIQVLEEKTVMPEHEFKELVENYYQLVKHSTSNDEANKLLKNIARLEFKEIQHNFKLIADDYPKIDVFIEYDAEAVKVWKEFQRIQEITDPSEKRSEFTRIKKQLRDYIISVPEKYKEDAGYMDAINMGYISKMIIEQTGVYDKQLGFLKEQTTNTLFA